MWPHESFPKRPRRVPDLDLMMVIVMLLLVVGLMVLFWRGL